MKEKYVSDLADIKEIMDKSSRFISLSGLSGVAAGICALVSAYVAYNYIYTEAEFSSYRIVASPGELFTQIFVLAAVTLLAAVGTGILFTTQKAKKQQLKLWDKQSKRLVINLAIPLVAGGMLCLILLQKGFVGLLAPLTLIFYGLALVNASKYTLHEIRSLGIIEIVLGLLSAHFIGYGLLFWTLGFGLLHIGYGIAMHLKYK